MYKLPECMQHTMNNTRATKTNGQGNNKPTFFLIFFNALIVVFEICMSIYEFLFMWNFINECEEKSLGEGRTMVL